MARAGGVHKGSGAPACGGPAACRRGPRPACGVASRARQRVVRLTSVASLRRVTEADVARTWLHWRAGGADAAASGLGHVGRVGDGATGEGELLRSALVLRESDQESNQCIMSR